MNYDSQNIFGNRLKMARKMAGLSLQDLANALQSKVSKQALSKYEQGVMKPSNDVLLAIANTMSLKPDYFLKLKSIELGEIQFRKRVRLAKKDQESIVEKVRDYVERFLEIENILGIDSNFSNPLHEFQINNKDDVENAAIKLRHEWDLGEDPIYNIVETLEQKGVKIYLSEEVEDFDGLAVYSSSGIPIIAVNSKNKPIERLRFTVIHELAHLLLPFNSVISTDEKLVEKFCHYFSSNFIIPRNSLINKIGGKRDYIRIAELISIKKSYGISIRATVYRLREINVISEVYYRRWIIFMSKQYGSKNEPGEYFGIESPVTFDLLVNRALSEDYISISKASALWNISVNEIRKGFGGK